MTYGLTTKNLCGQIVNSISKVCTSAGSIAEDNKTKYDFQAHAHVIGGAADNHTMYPDKIPTQSRVYYYYNCTYREDSKKEIGNVQVVCVNLKHKNLSEKTLSECTKLLYKYIHDHGKKFHRSVVMCLSHITNYDQNNRSNDTQQDQIYIHLKTQPKKRKDSTYN